MASRQVEIKLSVADLPQVKDALTRAADLVEGLRRLVATFDGEAAWNGSGLYAGLRGLLAEFDGERA